MTTYKAQSCGPICVDIKLRGAGSSRPSHTLRTEKCAPLCPSSCWKFRSTFCTRSAPLMARIAVRPPRSGLLQRVEGGPEVYETPAQPNSSLVSMPVPCCSSQCCDGGARPLDVLIGWHVPRITSGRPSQVHLLHKHSCYFMSSNIQKIVT